MFVVVGGHSRNIGKTSVAVGLIRALPQWNWTAMKITQFGHGICSQSGAACECHLEPQCPFAVLREREPNDSDSGRFLAAGARESYWVRTAMGHLGNALPAIREIQAASENLIVESNSILEFLHPDLYLVVLDPKQPDFKPSSARFLARADAFIFVGDAAAPQSNTRPQFRAHPPEYVIPALVDFVSGAGHRPPATVTQGRPMARRSSK